MSKNKADCQRIHATKRAKERFDLDLNSKDYDQLVNMIQKGKAKFLRKQSNRVSLFNVNFKEQDMDIVYDKNRKTVVTFLYPNTPYDPSTEFSSEFLAFNNMFGDLSDGAFFSLAEEFGVL